MATKQKRGGLFGFFKNLFVKRSDAGILKMLNGTVPIYTTAYGQNIYTSDVVQQAVYSIVTELKKLDPCHVRMQGSDPVPQAGSIQNVLDAPNPLMTTSDFLEKVYWNLLLNYNSFIYQVWEGTKLKALYPLQPTLVEFDNDYGGTGEIWVRMTFSNGMVETLPYENLIHLRYKYAFNDYMGGNENGQPDFQPLMNTLDLNDKLLKGLAKSLNIQTSINGVVKLKQMHNYDDQVKAVQEFEKKLQANESGLLPIDISADYMPVTKQIQLVDATTLEFVDRKILRNWGVSIAIINGDYTKDQYEAFYQKVCEPIVKSSNQAFTKGIFTRKESQGFNNKIVFYVKELIFMNTTQKLELFTRLGERGSCYENEYRTAFGMRPIPELEGVRMMSLNYVNSEYAKEYQTGNKEEPSKEESEVNENE